MVVRLRPDWLTRPHPDRLRPTHPRYEALLEAHAAAVARRSSMYRDIDTGAMVMTAAYLADRGYCCSAGCRHCPYLGAP